MTRTGTTTRCTCRPSSTLTSRMSHQSSSDHLPSRRNLRPPSTPSREISPPMSFATLARPSRGTSRSKHSARPCQRLWLTFSARFPTPPSTSPSWTPRSPTASSTRPSTCATSRRLRSRLCTTAPTTRRMPWRLTPSCTVRWSGRFRRASLTVSSLTSSTTWWKPSRRRVNAGRRTGRSKRRLRRGWRS